MPVKSADERRAAWLVSQINTARQNLSEWPDWMKQAAGFEGAGKVNKPKVMSGKEPSRPKKTK